MEVVKIEKFWEMLALNNPIHLLRLAREKGELTAIDIGIFREREILCNWLIKNRFNTRHKIKIEGVKLKEINSYKSIANVYSVLFDACEKLFTIVPESQLRYKSPLHWWTLIVTERVVEGINLGTKRKTIEYLKSCNRKLANYENFIPREYPHTFLVIDLLLLSSQKDNCQFDLLRKNVFLPLKKALANYVKTYQSPVIQFCRVEDDRYFAIGSNNQKIPIDKKMTLKEIEEWQKKVKRWKPCRVRNTKKRLLPFQNGLWRSIIE